MVKSCNELIIFITSLLQREHEQNRSSSSSSSSASSKIWDSIQSPRSQPSYHHSNHPDYKSSRSKPSQFDELLRDHMNRKSDSVPKNPNESCRSEDCTPKPLYIRAPNTTSMTECSRKRKTSFKPNTDHLSSRLSNHGNDLKKIINQPPPKRDRSHDSQRASSSDSQSESSKKSHSETSESSGKVELKKSTIRSEITKILYKYNHDYITSKIVRTMLMQKFGCDLTPHKKYIDDTIMELLDIIDNNPINLKSIPGRVFVEGKIALSVLFITGCAVNILFTVHTYTQFLLGQRYLNFLYKLLSFLPLFENLMTPLNT